MRNKQIITLARLDHNARVRKNTRSRPRRVFDQEQLSVPPPPGHLLCLIGHASHQVMGPHDNMGARSPGHVRAVGGRSADRSGRPLRRGRLAAQGVRTRLQTTQVGRRVLRARARTGEVAFGPLVRKNPRTRPVRRSSGRSGPPADLPRPRVVESGVSALTLPHGRTARRHPRPQYRTIGDMSSR